MTLASALRSPPAATAPARAAAALALLALWFLLHPYKGVVHDSRLYVGHALATLDPGGVGADFMFALDGQFRFSLFPKVLAAAVAALGPAGAAKLLSASGLALWFAAAAALAVILAPPRVAAAMLAALAALESAYGGFGVLHYAEPMATPRLFAEAGVLAGLAAALRGRTGVAAGLTLFAAAFHPIMALAGAGTLFLAACRKHPQLLWMLSLGPVVLVVGWFTGVPPFDRLAPIDAEWLAHLRERQVYVFPTLWPSGAFEALAARAAALWIALRFAPPDVARLLRGTLLVGLLGLLGAVLLGDLVPLQIVVQAQPWRALWLPMALGAAAAPLAAAGLWREGEASRPALGLLALTFALSDTPLVVALAGAAVAADRFRGRLPASPLIAKGLFGLAGLAFAGMTAITAFVWWKAAASTPPEAVTPFALFVLRAPLALPLAAAAAVFAMLAPPVPRRGLLAAAVALPALAALLWDNTTSVERALDSGKAPEGLAAVIGPGQGEVLWLGPDPFAPWMWLSRPAWAAPMQASGAVFSRGLDMTWRARMQALLDLGLVARDVFSQYAQLDPVVFPDLSAQTLTPLCARKDAPALIVAPVRAPQDAPPGARIWRSPPLFMLLPQARRWERIDQFAIVPCADGRPMRP